MASDEVAMYAIVGLVFSLIMFPMAIVAIVGHNAVADLPQGLCIANSSIVNLDIGSFSSSVVIEPVIVDMNHRLIPSSEAQLFLNLKDVCEVSKFDHGHIDMSGIHEVAIHFPPPPTSLNLQSEDKVQRISSSVMDAKNGILCYVDLEKNIAYIHPIGLAGWVVALVCACIGLLLALSVCACAIFG